MDIWTDLFDCLGLQINTKKTKVVTFVLVKIRISLFETVGCKVECRKCGSETVGRKVERSKCGNLLVVGSLASHRASQHNVYQLCVLDGEERRGTTFTTMLGGGVLPCGGLLPFLLAGLPTKAARL